MVKSKRAREAETATAAAEDFLPIGDSTAPEPVDKKRKRSDDDAADQVKQKKAKKDKKKKYQKESRNDKKDERKNLQDLPEEDNADVEPTNGADAAGSEDTNEVKTKKKSKDSKKEKKSQKKSEQDSETADVATTTDKKKKKDKKKQKQADKDEAPAAEEEEEYANGASETSKNARHIVFVGNLPFTATSDTIKAHFASLNPISVRCLKNKDDANPCRGIAFVEFANVWTMRTCLDKFHHTMFEDGVSAARKINVELTFVHASPPPRMVLLYDQNEKRANVSQ